MSEPMAAPVAEPPFEVLTPTPDERAAWEPRADGSAKGLGYFGFLRRPGDENYQGSSELSVGVQIDGKQVEIPSIVPSLSYGELKHLLSGGEPTPQILQKAADFAVQRMKAGLPVWAMDGEQGAPPVSEDQLMRQGFWGTP